MSGYNCGVRQRPTIFMWLAFLLTVLVGSGPALPAAGMWQCRYASRVVSSASVFPGAMPCHSMPMSMRGMACCAGSHEASAGGAQLASADCHPTFTALIVVSSAAIEQGRVVHPLMAAVPAAPSRGLASVAPVLLTLPLRQRPPPGATLLRSCFASAHRLRGPPPA